ncbi:MAG: hypothetical protein RL264_866 [Bacteroidota bacterium]|jgi:hypothetical protein
MEKTIQFLLISISILALVILYRLLLRRFSRGRVRQEDYCVLYSLETNPVNGEIEFYFTTPISKKVAFYIWKEKEIVQCLRNEEFTKGGHIIRFDSTTLENGEYFFGIVTEAQQTIKRFKIQN